MQYFVVCFVCSHMQKANEKHVSVWPLKCIQINQKYREKKKSFLFYDFLKCWSFHNELSKIDMSQIFLYLKFNIIVNCDLLTVIVIHLYMKHNWRGQQMKTIIYYSVSLPGHTAEKIQKYSNFISILLWL